MKKIVTTLTDQSAGLLMNHEDFKASSYMRLRSLKGYSSTEFLLELTESSSREFVLKKDDDRLLGALRLSCRDPVAQTIRMSLYCASALHAREISCELSGICDQLFLNEHIRRVYCFVLESEALEQHILFDSGFIKEATLTDHSFYDGKYHAVIVYGWIKDSK